MKDIKSKIIAVVFVIGMLFFLNWVCSDYQLNQQQYYENIKIEMGNHCGGVDNYITVLKGRWIPPNYVCNNISSNAGYEYVCAEIDGEYPKVSCVRLR
jgi:hypothetical protein